jgi:hypothetical protein
MSGKAQLAQTGLPVLVVGGVAYNVGIYMAGLAAALLVVGLLALKFGFRRNLDISQASAAEPKVSRGRHGR